MIIIMIGLAVGFIAALVMDYIAPVSQRKTA